MNDARARRVFTVLEFTNGMARWFAARSWLQAVAISGELSGLREFGGNLGFTLKEGQAVLDCVLWSNQREDVPQIQNGTAVIAYGSVRVRPDRSGYQLVVESLELTGIGALFALHERLKEKLRCEGLFEPARKRPVPALPRRVVVISARGKGLEDFVQTLDRSVPFVAVQFIETRVQGQGAEIDIAAALDQASSLRPDVIVLTRGGGTYEDLFPFNREPVVRAIVRAKVPVVTAIAHSGDHHLADDVADMTFGTPSLAAEHIAKGWSLAIRRLESGQRDLVRAVRNALGGAAQRADARVHALGGAVNAVVASRQTALASRARRLDALSPQGRIADWRARGASGAGRLGVAMATLLAARERRLSASATSFERVASALPVSLRHRLDRAHAALDRVDPLAPLGRGYAIITKDGKALRSTANLAPGDAVTARLLRGTFGARVESVRADD